MKTTYHPDDIRPVVRPDDLWCAKHTRRPLSASLERQVRAICSRSAPMSIEALPVAHGAPTSLAELLEQTQGEARTETQAGTLRERGVVLGERIPVWSGASDRTIWSCASMNHLFRAWHDTVHIELCAEFSLDGEIRVARAQCSRIEGKPERAILWAETAGQVLYHAAHGAFPKNQRQFVLDYIRHGGDVTVARGLYHAA